MSIVKQLRAMPTPALIALVDDLYGRNADIDKTIEKHLGQQRDAPEPLPNLLPYLQRQVSQVTSSHEFIDYHIAPSFAQRPLFSFTLPGPPSPPRVASPTQSRSTPPE